MLSAADGHASFRRNARWLMLCGFGLLAVGCRDVTVLVGRYNGNPRAELNAGQSGDSEDVAGSGAQGLPMPVLPLDVGTVGVASDRATSQPPGSPAETVAVEQGSLKEYCAGEGPPVSITADESAGIRACRAGLAVRRDGVSVGSIDDSGGEDVGGRSPTFRLISLDHCG